MENVKSDEYQIEIKSIEKFNYIVELIKKTVIILFRNNI